MIESYAYIDFLQEAINMAESNSWNKFGKSLKSLDYDVAVRIYGSLKGYLFMHKRQNVLLSLYDSIEKKKSKKVLRNTVLRYAVREAHDYFENQYRDYKIIMGRSDRIATVK